MGYIKKSERVLANGHRVVSIYNGMWGGVSDRIEYNKNNEPIAYWSHGILAWGINVPVEIGDDVYKLTYEQYVAWRKDKELPNTKPMKQYHLDENLVCRNKECVQHTWRGRCCLVAQCSATHLIDEQVFTTCPECILGYREKDENGTTIYD